MRASERGNAAFKSFGIFSFARLDRTTVERETDRRGIKRNTKVVRPFFFLLPPPLFRQFLPSLPPFSFPHSSSAGPAKKRGSRGESGKVFPPFLQRRKGHREREKRKKREGGLLDYCYLPPSLPPQSLLVPSLFSICSGGHQSFILFIFLPHCSRDSIAAVAFAFSSPPPFVRLSNPLSENPFQKRREKEGDCYLFTSSSFSLTTTVHSKERGERERALVSACQPRNGFLLLLLLLLLFPIITRAREGESRARWRRQKRRKKGDPTLSLSSPSLPVEAIM